MLGNKSERRPSGEDQQLVMFSAMFWFSCKESSCCQTRLLTFIKWDWGKTRKSLSNKTITYMYNASHIFILHIYMKHVVGGLNICIQHEFYYTFVIYKLGFICFSIFFCIPISSIKCHWKLLNYFRNQSDRK